MTIKNLSNKLIGIGGDFILPGNEAGGFKKDILQSNAVRSYIRLGLISVTEEAGDNEKATETAAATPEDTSTEAPEAPAPSEAEPKKRPGRRKAAE